MKRQLILSFVLALSTAAAAFSQQSTSSFEEFTSRLNSSDQVRIVDKNGKKTNGTIVSVSGSTVRVTVDSMIRKETRDFSAGSIRSAWKVNKDSTLDGKLIGGGVGAVLFVLSAFGGGGSDAYNGNTAGVVGVYGALGFGIGALIGGAIDASNVRTEKLYESAVTSRQFGVQPILSKEKTGVAVAFRF